MIKELIQLANHLDNKGFTKQADYLDFVIRKTANNANKKTNWFRQNADQGGALGQAVISQGFEYQNKSYNSQQGTIGYSYIQKQEDGSVARVTLTWDTYMPPSQQTQQTRKGESND
ncbi:MAG: hypothetical protein CBE07_001475 [Pelagibacteraceae bacterium TMED247]|nr:MAG: hypothetical protein CBE07_001475 [Pelagibacteraceae bacterium TMED247]|tara:strand:- start:587 stop:934 length:348 start_codon:yes stop_codon:yes gene_type:complete